MKGTLTTVAILVIIAFCLTLALASAASAIPDVTVTPATGGEAISADTFGTGTHTPLGPIVITEGAAGDIGTGTIILDVPTGFEFSTDPVPDVAVTGDGELVVETPITVTTTQITITVTTASTTATNTLTIGGSMHIGVCPTQGTPLASGNIVMDDASTSAIAGVTEGTTNFGTLTEVHGAATKFVIINPTDGSVDAPITVTVQLQDQYGNVITTGADKDKDVTLTADGSATGAGLVNVTNGVGTIDISDHVAETVNLGLTDSQTTGFDVTSTQDVVFAPGAIDHYTVTSASTTQTVDVAFTVTVTAYDEYDNVATNAGLVRVCMSSNPAIIVFNAEGDEDFSDTTSTDICDNLSNGTFNIPAKAISTYTGVTITACDEYDPITEECIGKTGTSNAYIISAADGDGNGTPTPTPTPTPTGPTIAFIPSSFTFMATEGGDNPASRTLGISNSGGGTLSWSVSEDATWLTLSPASGTATTETNNVTVSVDISGMSAGMYNAIITISASGATNKTVAVTLTISAPLTPTYTVGTAESWVETDDGKIILHFRAGSFASETNISIALKTIHGDAPEDFTLGETCFSITAEAELLRSIDVCVRYTDADVAAADGDPGKLRLAVYDETEGEWDVLSTSIDERTRTACARVKHLSDFAILAGPGPPGFFSADWWTVWWHITPIAVGLVIVIAVAIWLWSRYKYYY